MPTEWALEVLTKAPYITLSMTEQDGTPYAIPLSLAKADNGCLYFHGAQEGKKIEILKQNNKVCLSAVTKCKPVVGPKDNSFTLEFQSAIAFGIAEEVTDEDEKIYAMKTICERFLPNHMAAFNSSIERSLQRTAVYKITLTSEPTGKRKQYDKNGDELKYGRME